MAARRSIGRQWWFHIVLAVLGSCLVLFVVAPLIGMVVTTSMSELSAAARDRVVLESIRVTLFAALWATLACTVVGVPLAYLLARKRFGGRSLLLAIIDLPIAIPHTVAGIALLTVIGRGSWLGQLLGGGLVGTQIGISVAMAFVSLPFLVNAAREGFEAVPLRLEKAARSLGASPRQVFFTVSLPLAWRGIVSGMSLMWARGISEFGALIIIAYYPMTTPVLVYQRLNDYGLSYARAAALLLVVVCIAVFAFLRFLARPTAQQREDPDA